MGTPGWKWWVGTARAVILHPSVWGAAAVQVGRLAPAGWWRRPPFLPTPDPGYMRFRLETQYGSDQPPDPHDVVAYLHWCRRLRTNR